MPLRECRWVGSLTFGAVKHDVLNGVSEIAQDRYQPGWLKPDRSELADRHPAEPVAGLDAALQILGSQQAGPGEQVIQADLMLQGAAVVDVLHDKRDFPGWQVVPEFLGKFTGQGLLPGFAEAGSSAGQEPVAQAIDCAQQDLITAGDDGRHPQVKCPAGPAPGNVGCHHHCHQSRPEVGKVKRWPDPLSRSTVDAAGEHGHDG